MLLHSRPVSQYNSVLISNYFIRSSHMGSGQQCCYRQDGSLLVGPRSGGSVDLVAPNGIINTVRHFVEDVIPAIYCCKGLRSESTCQLYYDHRPSDNGSRYNPPTPGKDSISLVYSIYYTV